MNRLMAMILTASAFAAPALAGGTINVRATLLSGDFAPGEGLVSLLIAARQDGVGADYQLFNGLQGNLAGTGLWVDPADASKVQISQVSYLGGAISTEAEATAHDGAGGYVKADDTWFCQTYSNFLSGPTADNTVLWRFAATRSPGNAQDAAEFLHLVLRKTAAYDGTPARVYLGGKWGLVGVPANGVAFSGLVALEGTCGDDGNERVGAISIRRIAGDADQDGSVAFDDYQMLEQHFGTGAGAAWTDGDFDGDGAVAFADYQMLEQNFGVGVPEPAGAALLLAGAGVLLRRGRPGGGRAARVAAVSPAKSLEYSQTPRRRSAPGTRGRASARDTSRLAAAQGRAPAFTLVELLVVVAVIALLVAILLPSLAAAKTQTRKVLCQSNLRQLHIANHTYSVENNDSYVPAAPDIFEDFGGRRRWHGVRESGSVNPDPAKNNFDPRKGPLRKSLFDGKVNECPEVVDYVEAGALNAFEASCGGYGYNSVGVGSRTYKFGYSDEAMRSAMRTSEIRRPTGTVMFTDTAFVQGYPQRYLIEYSFCEPPRYINPDGAGGFVEEGSPAPSIHFRHRHQANVVWCDGHAGGEPLAFTTLEDDTVRQFTIGWFGPQTNELFKPF